MNLICRTCGSQLLAGTSFCRQCGSAINPEDVVDSSEKPTSLFTQTNSVATQRFDPRPTSGPEKSSSGAGSIASQPVRDKRKLWRPVLALTVVGLVIATLVTVAAISRIRTHSRTTSVDALLYPGAQKVVDVTSQDGGRALHLQTSDPFKKVEDWYQQSLQPQKTVRLTSTSVVLKNENTTATIASEGGMTNILIKMKGR
jgi:hypothetical protein